MQKRRWLAGVVAAFCVAGNVPVTAQPPGAQDEVAVLFQQAAEALEKRQYDRAEQLFQGAYARAESDRNVYGMGASLDALGNVYMERGDIKKALSVKTKAIELLRVSDNPKGLARALMNTGITLGKAGRTDDAIAMLEEAVTVWMKLKDEGATAAGLLSLSGAYKDDGQFQKAIATLGQVAEIRTQIKAGPGLLAEPYNDLGLVYETLAQYDAARQAITTAIQLAQQANDPKRYASGLNNLGVTLMAQGRYPEAVTAHQEALAIREKGDNPDAVSGSLSNLGIVAHGMGRYDYALFYFRRALAIAEKTDSKPLIASTYGNMGLSLQVLGQRQKATESQLKALTLYEEIGDPSGTATAAFNVAGLLMRDGMPQKAVGVLEKVLPVAQKKGDAKWVAQTQGALGQAYATLGQNDKALAQFEAAHAFWEKVKNPNELGKNCNDLANVYSQLGRAADAAKMYEAALAVRGTTGNPQSLSIAQSNFAQLAIEQGQWDKAATLLKEAIANQEKVRDEIAAPSQIGAAQDGMLSDAYGRYARVLLQSGKPDEALAQVERGRGQGLARQAAQSRTEWKGVLLRDDAGQLAKATKVLRQASDALRSIEKQVARINSIADDDSLRAARQEVQEATRVRDEAQQALSDLRNNIAARSATYRTVCGLDTPTPESFTALAKANPDTLYLTWNVGMRDTVLFAFADGVPVKAFTLPLPRRDLTRKVDQWREALSPSDEGRPGDDAASEEKQGQALYTALLGEVEKAGLLKPAIKRLVVLGDGPLRELPFAALVDTGGKRLIARYPLTTGISLRLLTPTPASPDTTTPPARGILCVADQGGGAATADAREALDGFAPLPAARREGKAIATLFGSGATLLVGTDATKAAVTPHLTSARLLHFATHGLLDDEHGLNSGVLLAPAADEKDEDGDPTSLPLLTASDILDQKLGADLVVLSACETGRGEKSGGDGLLGLVWAFRASGCGSVIASQWSVDDDATGRLMVRFYENLRAGKRRDDALQDAMLLVHADPKSAPPFFWAAFQLHGDGAPLPSDR